MPRGIARLRLMRARASVSRTSSLQQEEETMQILLDNQHKDMKLQIQGLIPPGQQLHRNVLFDHLYA